MTALAEMTELATDHGWKIRTHLDADTYIRTDATGKTVIDVMYDKRGAVRSMLRHHNGRTEHRNADSAGKRAELAKWLSAERFSTDYDHRIGWVVRKAGSTTDFMISAIGNKGAVLIKLPDGSNVHAVPLESVSRWTGEQHLVKLTDGTDYARVETWQGGRAAAEQKARELGGYVVELDANLCPGTIVADYRPITNIKSVSVLVSELSAHAKSGDYATHTRTGRAVDQGYIVQLDGTQVPLTANVESDVREFIVQFEEWITEAEDGAFRIYTMRDPETCAWMYVTDQVLIIPDRERAFDLAIEHGVPSIFDAVYGDEIDVPDNRRGIQQNLTQNG
ncbi:hypothetical protein F5X71_34670 [Nocardia brasiliensis]|uniref:Uncharacterized protein n=1 Tax=Nocardia brasiliensis TaxID=37326 RepID=A0A6G9Y0Q6_NOCBR|nr:hypothetical protein [Nocardia brasiliensis]QIS06771.1 hypothetical protein F5X71_34670 [Nocardia brasiliensis]